MVRRVSGGKISCLDCFTETIYWNFIFGGDIGWGIGV